MLWDCFQKKDKPTKCRFAHKEGIDGFPIGFATDVFLNDGNQTVEFKMPLSKKEPAVLDYSQIITVSQISEKEMIEKNKSVVGRAVVGGVLLGGVGAVVGGMSGIGDKKEEKRTSYIKIEFNRSYPEGETGVILLEIVGASMGYDKFKNALQERTSNGKQISNHL